MDLFCAELRSVTKNALTREDLSKNPEMVTLPGIEPGLPG
jgi:hypothetical protein